MPQAVLVRHGETEWSRVHRHTGRTDVPLTTAGSEKARLLGPELAEWTFALVLTSPLRRALDTCRLAGYGEVAALRDDLKEWDYGAYEGRTRAEIRAERPGWSLWTDGVPGGESPDDVGRRADRIIGEVRAAPGDAAIFAHGHILRVLAARWIGLTPAEGRLFALDTAAIGVVGYERETTVLARWNLVREMTTSPPTRETSAPDDHVTDKGS
jgi:probable phosphoglycerate mutase